jgi:hypothetical protein
MLERAPGARAQVARAYDMVYGTPPVSGFRLTPFAGQRRDPNSRS